MNKFRQASGTERDDGRLTQLGLRGYQSQPFPFAGDHDGRGSPIQRQQGGLSERAVEDNAMGHSQRDRTLSERRALRPFPNQIELRA